IRRNSARQRVPRKTMWRFDCGTSCEPRPGVGSQETGSVVTFEFFWGGRPLLHPNPYVPKSPQANVLVVVRPAAPNTVRASPPKGRNMRRRDGQGTRSN